MGLLDNKLKSFKTQLVPSLYLKFPNIETMNRVYFSIFQYDLLNNSLFSRFSKKKIQK